MTAESRLSFRRFHCICNESKRLCLQKQKLRQKGNTFSKKDQVNLNLKSLFLYHIFRMRTSSQGEVQDQKDPYHKAELSRELLDLHV